ncbi:hypothetical protein BCR39DRAFT_468244 [Naematelia encephala]|uniref:TM7S3/TM198-like domain-containing protein n=1 Tax=Naematelia encephala TaxID=71784 RepID=A0A1Y2B0T4_9TREE|nr:hypothetical protein BCR39DRAFT_468244 [Naematelia encephala]
MWFLLHHFAILAFLSSILISAQSSSTSTISRSSNSPSRLLTTTITSLVTPTSGSASPSPSTLVLTLTLNGSSLDGGNGNGSLVNQTALNNATTSVPWNETDAWLPFHIKIDPAYGVLGALLITSGIPVAVLGGKNRWSSLAIASGYSVMLFTLVLILRFGVQPNLQPPSPNPPSTTLRGLYLLACIISSSLGAALGIFLFNFAKYWVSAAGGFAFGWFLLATRSGGLIDSVLGRWGLLGGLTVMAFVASLPKVLEPHMMLISTAWIGATAFTLGVDCYTRGGLKEFYIYNLGFHDLFPSLNGMKYPLTQTMEIELGILAAMVIIGAAIQFRLLNVLQKRLKQMRDEEEARIEAEEVSRAAERFKNVGSELNEWEEKHGKGSMGTGSTPPSTLQLDRTSVVLPQLGFDEDQGRRTSSALSLLPPVETRSLYDSLPLNSPPLENGTPTTGRFSMMEELNTDQAVFPSPALTDPELESKMRLLDEVKRAREEVRTSLDKLRATTPTPSLAGRLDRAIMTPTPTLSVMGLGDPMQRQSSGASSRVLDYADKPRITSQSEWDQYISERKLITPPALASPATPASAALTFAPAMRHSQYAIISEGSSRFSDRRERTTSMLEPRVSDFGPFASQARIDTYPVSQPMPSRRASSMVSLDNERAETYRNSQLGPPVILGSAARPYDEPVSRPMVQRTMTYEELAERHRKRLSKLQEPVTAKMREQVDVAEAKAKWEREKRMEREEMRRKEREKAGAGISSSSSVMNKRDMGVERQEVLKSTDEWRKSVGGGLDAIGIVPPVGATPRKKRMSTTSFVN